jgi:hypothetical protein
MDLDLNHSSDCWKEIYPFPMKKHIVKRHMTPVFDDKNQYPREFMIKHSYNRDDLEIQYSIEKMSDEQILKRNHFLDKTQSKLGYYFVEAKHWKKPPMKNFLKNMVNAEYSKFYVMKSEDCQKICSDLWACSGLKEECVCQSNICLKIIVPYRKGDYLQKMKLLRREFQNGNYRRVHEVY